MSRAAVFAIPGDIDALTGGYIYEKQLLLALRRLGWEVTHLALPGSYPTPTPADLETTMRALAAVPPDVPALLDGFLSGATPPEALARMRAPMVPICHHPLALETGLDPSRAAALHRIEAANLARAAHIVVPSPHTRAILCADFGVVAEQVTVAAPGTARPAGPAAPVDPPLILSVGQLVPRKGHDTLLEALARLTDLPWQAEIVGAAPDPDHRAALLAQRARLGLEARVSIVGTLAPEALGQRYRAATLFALATHYEGYGMVFAEALAHGLPIVAGNRGAVPDTVPAGAGHLVPPGDPGALADALHRILTEDGVRAGLAAGAAAAGAALPTWDDTARTVAEVLAQVGATG